jgi:hypothetical protein
MDLPNLIFACAFLAAFAALAAALLTDVEPDPNEHEDDQVNL